MNDQLDKHEDTEVTKGENEEIPDDYRAKIKDPSEPSERIEEADYTLFRVPGIDHPITPNEIHASVIGLATGLMVAWISLYGFETAAAVSMVFLVGYAVIGPPIFDSLPHADQDFEKTVALKTIRHEPWWFLFFFSGTSMVVFAYV